MNNSLIIAIITSSAFATLISNLFNLYRDSKVHADGIAEGVMYLLYDRIKYLAKHYISDGAISPEDLEDLTNMWVCYHDTLGGNGYLDTLMNAVKRLPIK